MAAKFQLARFEAFGAPGRELLGELAAAAREQGLLIIADGKRGDIDVTAAAYASALFDGLRTPLGELGGLGADLATVNPLMGRDAVEPFLAAARRSGAGILLLVRTSNAGAQDVQDLPLADGRSLWESLAELVDRLGRDGRGDSGLSDVGAVMGASDPAHLPRARELMPAAPFLLPGVGAQGGEVAPLAAAFAPGRAGGLVSASRSIAGAFRELGGEPAAAAREAATRLREQAWTLSGGF